MKKQASKKAALSPAKSKTAAKLRARQLPAPDVSADNLLTDIRELIAGAKTRVAQAVNAGQLLLNWHIGNRIRTDILGGKRADYGEQIVQTLSAQLAAEYGRAYSRANLFNMIRFAEVFPNREIVQTLSKQVGWSSAARRIYNQIPRGMIRKWRYWRM